jgi:hypothetical protein
MTRRAHRPNPAVVTPIPIVGTVRFRESLLSPQGWAKRALRQPSTEETSAVRTQRVDQSLFAELQCLSSGETTNLESEVRQLRRLMRKPPKNALRRRNAWMLFRQSPHSHQVMMLAISDQ